MIKLLLRAAVAAAMMAAAIYAAVVWGVYHHIATALEFAFGPYIGGLPAAVAGSMAPVAAGLVALPLTGLVIRLAFGLKLQVLLPVVMSIFVLAAAGWTWMTRDWLFDLKGRPLVYVCPAVQAGSVLRVQRQQVDHTLGGSCPPVNSETAALIIMQRNGKAPEEVVVKSVEELNALPRYSASGPALFVGEPLTSDSPPRLFRTGGVDSWTGKTLRPVAELDIEKIRSWIVAQQRAASAAEAALLERERKDAHAQSQQETQQQLAQEQARLQAQLQAERQVREQEDARRAQVIRRTTPAWMNYFDGELDDTAPLMVVFGAGSSEQKIRLSGVLSGGRWWPESVAQQQFLDMLTAAAVTSNPFAGITKNMLPPGLKTLTVARVGRIYHCRTNDGEIREVAEVNYITLDIRAWSYQSRQTTVYI